METAKLMSVVIKRRESSVRWALETGSSAVYSSGHILQ
jgi:hypothetical protein